MIRLIEVVGKENLHTTNDGLEAIIFTAQGDMRQVSPGGVAHDITIAALVLNMESK